MAENPRSGLLGMLPTGLLGGMEQQPIIGGLFQLGRLWGGQPSFNQQMQAQNLGFTQGGLNPQQALARALRAGISATDPSIGLMMGMTTPFRANPFVPSSTLVDDIARAARDANAGYLGLRVDEGAQPFGRGATLRPSRIWDDGVPTTGLLPGTSSIGLRDMSRADIERALEALTPYYGNRLTLIGGGAREFGEDAAESIIRDALALGSWTR